MAKILVVDDEEYIRQYYTEELFDEGYQVETMASGHQLLRRITLLQPDVVVLDIKLMEHNGLELLQDIRNHYYDLPVILCTAYDTYKEDQRSMAADYCVIKSFDLSELKTKIKRAIETYLPAQLTGS